jgi:hypothetical protein
MMTHAAPFAPLFVALYAAHQVGDHWLQTPVQAADKGKAGWCGRLACARHVIGLTCLKSGVIALVMGVLGLQVSPVAVLVALLVDAVSHWWIDRRTTLLALADALEPVIPGKGAFARLGDGQAAPAGTGAYALDQSFHIAFLLVAALIGCVGVTL